MKAIKKIIKSIKRKLKKETQEEWVVRMARKMDGLK